MTHPIETGLLMDDRPGRDTAGSLPSDGGRRAANSSVTVLTVSHRTAYRYARPVRFGEHRLMFRPRDSHDLRLLGTSLLIRPRATVRWMHDVFGNSVATARFEETADELVFESSFRVQHYPIAAQEIELEPYARHFPFHYAADEIPDLGRATERHYADPQHKIDTWARQFLDEHGRNDTMAMLTEMTRTIKRDLRYVRRAEKGTRTPVRTLELGSGTCRDFALLMMEAVRSLGFAARFVSGYLYDEALIAAGRGEVGLDRDDSGTLVGGGETHAWVQVYLPGAGWVEFDPTNALIAGRNLIRVAVTRDPSQAIPLSGTYIGTRDDDLGMTVDVRVLAEPG